MLRIWPVNGGLAFWYLCSRIKEAYQVVQKLLWNQAREPHN